LTKARKKGILLWYVKRFALKQDVATSNFYMMEGTSVEYVLARPGG